MSAEPRKRVIILGSTGSIGTSALKVARDIPDRMEVVGLAASRNIETLAAQVAAHDVHHVALFHESGMAKLRARLPAGVSTYAGAQGLVDLVTEVEADMVLVAIVGTEGLRPALAAIESGKSLAVASKEILVMAGEAVMQAAQRKGVRVLPVDSEHNAIFQCLEGHRACEVSRLILTASGGPFRTWSRERIAAATVDEALRHPTWDMGKKITIDSATLFNKGLEMIEARWLFGVEIDRVEVVVHPQSIVHSMVEFIDGSVLAQLSHTDMCFPIQYAVTWPQRVPNSLPPLNFAALARLDFEAPRCADFPALDLARRAAVEGGTMPAALNAANEIAVAAFLDGRLRFPDIWRIVTAVMDRHQNTSHPALDAIVDADARARVEAASLCGAAQ